PTVQVRRALPSHEVWTPVKMGWGELENGTLLKPAEAAGFEVLIICDKNLRHQQNLTGRKIAILELWTNRRPILEKHGTRIQPEVPQRGFETCQSGRAVAEPLN